MLGMPVSVLGAEIKEDINSHSIGIELTNPTLGQTPYPIAQIKTLIKLCQQLIQKYNIPAHNIIGHSDMAPTQQARPRILLSLGNTSTTRNRTLA